jgi:hypothetical protein
VTGFFLPGVSNDQPGAETAYTELRRQVELDLGRPPNPRRILRLWTRRGAADCITQVGTPDPIRGGIVIAIFDMGPHQPFVVCHLEVSGVGDPIHEVLGCNAYTVDEFDR